MIKTALRQLILASMVLVVSGLAYGQTQPQDFDEWLNSRVREITKARINQRNNTNQSEAPSMSSNSTSLVDTSSASDLAGIALDLAGLSTESSEMKTTSMSATVSAYAFKAAADGRNPLDPAFYNANRNWRRVSFTLGFDYPEDNVGNINERATIFGIKYLPYDKRDASDPGNQTQIRAVSAQLQRTGIKFAQITRLIQDYLFNELSGAGKLPPNVTIVVFATDYITNFATKLLPLLGESETAAIDKIISDHIDPFVEFDDATREAVEQIRKKPQVSFALFAKQRRQDRPDEYTAEAIIDLGVAPRWNVTLNANFDYTDNKVTEDSRGARLATELQVQLTRENRLAGRMPWLLSVAGDGSWMTNVTPVYRAQAKLTIPFWEGFEFPISVSVASRTDLINETDVRGRFGFTFDLARLAKAFQGKFIH